MVFTFLLLAHLFLCTHATESNSKYPPIDDNLKAEILTEINKMRSSNQNCGSAGRYSATAPLAWSDQLAEASNYHAMDMHQNRFFEHTGSDGSRPSERIAQAGYTWAQAGENISVGISSPHEVVAAWMKSSGHCKTIMDNRFEDMGAARVGKYWVLTVASPR